MRKYIVAVSAVILLSVLAWGQTRVMGRIGKLRRRAPLMPLSDRRLRRFTWKGWTANAIPSEARGRNR
ncbi:hypothetical protein LJK88_33905 [Paenibacillus sp. P26]|nr:hypothetical protein LJK88_33905 [Paenibacillus sp. P26]